jgi:hypothetical protein
VLRRSRLARSSRREALRRGSVAKSSGSEVLGSRGDVGHAGAIAVASTRREAGPGRTRRAVRAKRMETAGASRAGSTGGSSAAPPGSRETSAVLKMEELPIARPDEATQEAVEDRVRETLALVDRRNEVRSVFLDWLAIEHGVVKPSRRLTEPSTSPRTNSSPRFGRREERSGRFRRRRSAPCATSTSGRPHRWPPSGGGWRRSRPNSRSW